MNRGRRKARRTQVERRNHTQAAILSAALRILSEEGYAGFSASRVAARAGVSRGAQEHYFPKKNDLIAAATRHTMQLAIEHARSLAQRASASSDPIEKFLSDSEHFFFRPVFRAMIEVMIAARADRSLARAINPIVQDARHVLNGIWTDTLDAAGYPREDAQRFVELTHYLMRGLFVVTTWLPYQVDRGQVMDVWQQLAPKILEFVPTRRPRARQAPSRSRPIRPNHHAAEPR
jgi:AcrR family transcriptional regulator